MDSLSFYDLMASNLSNKDASDQNQFQFGNNKQGRFNSQHQDTLTGGLKFQMFSMPVPSLPTLFQGPPSLNNSHAILSNSLDDAFDTLTNDHFDPVPLDSSSSLHRDDDQLLSMAEMALSHVLEREAEVDPFGQVNSIIAAAPSTAVSSNKRPSSPVSKKEPTSNKRRRTSAPSAPLDDYTTPRFRPYQEKQWVEQFQELINFKQERGHCCVPHTFAENPILSRWVKRQRYQYKLRNEGKASTMTESRIRQLEENGFVWDSHVASWEERRLDLEAYQKEHGDCNVPSNYSKNPQLATWVKCQRRQYKLFWNGSKPSNMTQERIASLNELGFQWELRGGGANKMNKTAPTVGNNNMVSLLEEQKLQLQQLQHRNNMLTAGLMNLNQE